MFIEALNIYDPIDVKNFLYLLILVSYLSCTTIYKCVLLQVTLINNSKTPPWFYKFTIIITIDELSHVFIIEIALLVIAIM